MGRFPKFRSSSSPHSMYFRFCEGHRPTVILSSSLSVANLLSMTRNQQNMSERSVPKPMRLKSLLGLGFIAVALAVSIGCSGFSSGSSSSSSKSSAVQFSVDSLPSTAVGVSYSAALQATGGVSPYSFAVASGTLPPGLALASSSGAVKGTPTTAGNFSFTIQVSDSSTPSQTAQKSFSVIVNPKDGLVIGTNSLPNGTKGTAYSANLAASGGTTPYVWTVTAGSLPPGLSLSRAGTISGTPTGSGQSSFTVQVADSSSPTQKASTSLSINISGTPGGLSITGSISPTATDGVFYSSTAQATGGTPPYTWSISAGSLPPGLSLAATTGTISGTPTQDGQYSFTLKATDSGSPPQNATSAQSITVSGNPLDQYGGIVSMPSQNPPTVWFRMEKFPNNKWMFVDPANNAFFMTAIYVLDQSTSNDDMGSNYYARTTAKYGDPNITWGPAQVTRMQSWGFNTVGPYASSYVLAVNTNNGWPGDGSNPVKAPFIGFFRPSYYGMTNENNWAPQPVKNMLAGVSQYYTGYRPYDGIADYYDGNWATFLTNELANDYAATMISGSKYKRYMIGVSLDDSDDLFGFGAGPDFTTEPQHGSNNAHLGWLVLVMSPTQTASSQYSKIYTDTTVYSKQALHDQMVAKYGTISALNSAWGSDYTTFDSSGTTINGQSVGTGDGSTTQFNATLTDTTVTPFTLQILVAGTPVGGDLGNGNLWGPGLSGSINSSTGALSVTFTTAPASGASITANYVQNGWGIGSGLMDEDGRPSHQGWVGTDYTYMTDVNPNLKKDLDSFLYQIANQYFSTGRAKVEAWLPGTLFMGPTTLGTWSVPSNRNVLKAATQSLDVMAIGGGWPMTQAELDFIYKYYGDKPFYVGAYRTANADSAFWRYKGGTSDFPTQQARGADYADVAATFPTGAYSANGSRPYVGVVWWQYLDNWGEKADWGLVSLSDNAYDGNEAVKGTGGVGHRTVICSAPLQQYLCGGEERNYGDVITSVKSAHQQIVQGVQQ